MQKRKMRIRNELCGLEIVGPRALHGVNTCGHVRRGSCNRLSLCTQCTHFSAHVLWFMEGVIYSTAAVAAGWCFRDRGQS